MQVQKKFTLELHPLRLAGDERPRLRLLRLDRPSARPRPQRGGWDERDGCGEQ